jgi:hypothetical protein
MRQARFVEEREDRFVLNSYFDGRSTDETESADNEFECHFKSIRRPEIPFSFDFRCLLSRKKNRVPATGTVLLSPVAVPDSSGERMRIKRQTQTSPTRSLCIFRFIVIRRLDCRFAFTFNLQKANLRSLFAFAALFGSCLTSRPDSQTTINRGSCFIYDQPCLLFRLLIPR